MNIFQFLQRAWRSLPDRRATTGAGRPKAVLRVEALELRQLLNSHAPMSGVVPLDSNPTGSLPGSTVLLEDNFDSENEATPVLNYDLFSNWNVTRGYVDLIGSGLYEYYPGHGLYVDLDGSFSASAGRLESKTEFTLAAGLYEL